MPEALTLQALTLRFLRNFRKLTAKNTTKISLNVTIFFAFSVTLRLQALYKNFLVLLKWHSLIKNGLKCLKFLKIPKKARCSNKSFRRPNLNLFTLATFFVQFLIQLFYFSCMKTKWLWRRILWTMITVTSNLWNQNQQTAPYPATARV